MRTMDFTTEQPDCCSVGDYLEIVEHELPTSYWYMLEHAYGASTNFKNRERLNILENNTTIRKGKIARKQGDNYIIQLIGSCGALTMPEDQLFESEEAAEKSRQQIKLNSANVQNDFISVKPDPFDNWIGR